MGDAMSLGIEAGGGDLVQHRLEQVVVAAVHHRHPDGRVAQRLGGVEPGEAAPENEHVRQLGGRARSSHRIPLVRQRPIVSRRQRANRITSSAGGTAASSAYAVYIRQRRYSRSGTGRNGGLRPPAPAPEGPRRPQQIQTPGAD